MDLDILVRDSLELFKTKMIRTDIKSKALFIATKAIISVADKPHVIKRALRKIDVWINSGFVIQLIV